MNSFEGGNSAELLNRSQRRALRSDNRRGRDNNQALSIAQQNFNEHSGEFYRKIHSSQRYPMPPMHILQLPILWALSKLGKPRLDLGVAELIYRGDPVVVDLAKATRSLSVEFGRINPTDADSKKIAAEDIYSINRGGLSLWDIENLPLPLSPADMKKINIFICGNSSKSVFEIYAQNIATLLPIEVAARGSEIQYFEELKPLYSRLQSYLDTYLPFLTGNELDDQIMNTFSLKFSFSTYKLFKLLATYLPARLGITPSSAANLMITGQESSDYRTPWRMLRKVMLQEVSGAYTENGVPEALRQNQYFNPNNDQLASDILLEQYRKAGYKDFDEHETKGIEDRLDEYRVILSKEVPPNKKRVVRFPVYDIPVIREIAATAQNKNVLIVVLTLADGTTHLTLELGRNRELYGIPYAMKRESPHIEDLIKRDLVGALGQRYQNIDPRNNADRIQVIKPEVLVPKQAPQDLPSTPTKTSRKRVKNGGRGTEVKEGSLEDSLLVIPARERTHTVYYTRSDVQGRMKNQPDKAVDMVCDSIAAFERGEKRIQALQKIDGLYRIRVGDWRVVLERLSGGTYKIYDVSRRDKIYQRNNL